MTAPAKKLRGRPALPPEEAQTEMIRERVTKAEREKYDLVGGKQWLRRALKRATVKKSPTAETTKPAEAGLSR